MRLLKNKLLIFNILSGIFYILGSSGYMTFLSKYMEVQFNKNPSNATIITGPVSIFGMVLGFIGSGYVISKYKPGPRKLFMWNVLVGIGCIAGQVSYMFLSCDNRTILTEMGTINLTSTCNMNCACDTVPYSPVCHEPSGTTYFSPCHAACRDWSDNQKIYSNCHCAGNSVAKTSRPPWIGMTSIPTTSSQFEPTPSIQLLSTTETITTTSDLLFQPISNQTNPKNSQTTVYSTFNKSDQIIRDYESKSETSLDDDYYIDELNATEQIRPKRSPSENGDDKNSILSNVMIPGACLAGCAYAFWIFTSIATFINCLGATGRIGNILLNFR